MKLKPSGDRQQLISPKLDGMGRPVAKEDMRNPFAQLARGLNPSSGRKRRPFADTLGATPARDGPFSLGAADVAAQKPPRGRQKRKKSAGLPFLGQR
jgi:hypothetical protein